MYNIRSSEAKARLAELLDKVEHGESIVITRHGRAIARLVPEPDSRQAEVDKALEAIQALRKRTKKISLNDILSSRHEGHKY